MPSDVLITPASSKIDFTDGSNATKRLNISGTAFSFNSNLNVLSSTSLSSAFKAEGINGTLFEITDDLSNSLMSVNTIGGLPVFEVFANNSIIAGQYNANDFVILGNKIGIGTASPTGKLTIFQGNNPGITLFSNNAAQYAYLQIGRTSSELEIGVVSGSNQFFTGTVTADAVIKQNSTGKLHLGYGSAAPSITIDSSNNVGIGNTGPNNKLYVAGSASIGSSYNVAAPTNGLIVQGEVGIGTTSPTNKLHIYSSANEPVLIQGTTAGTWLNFQSSTSNLLSIGADGTRGIGFYNRTTAADLMTISNGGNIGIGTVTPAYKLDVNSSIVSRSTLSSPRFSNAGTYVYGVTNSPTWNQSCGSAVNNNAIAPDGTTSAGTYTFTSTCGTYDIYQTISGLTIGRVYTVGMWVKLGTATNFCLVVNNTGAWNTIGGKAFTSSDGLSTGKWTHVSYTFTQPASSTAINLHLGYHAETAVTQQTAGTVFLWNIEMTEFSSTWIGNVEDEIRLPGSSIWTSRGNVGIGTTIPGAKLQINNASDSRLIVYETGASPYTATLELSSQTYGTYGGTIQYTSNAETLTIENYGRSVTNSVQGSILFKTKINNTTATNVAIINGFTGNVGIATLSPSEKLEVVGVIKGTSFSGAGTGLTGTASSLTAGTVTTNANLTGPITSVGNATTITNSAVTYAKIQNVNLNTVLGRITTTAGVVEELTGANIATIIGANAVTNAVTAGTANALNTANSYQAVSLNLTGTLQFGGNINWNHGVTTELGRKTIGYNIWQGGKKLNADEDFNSGNNGISVYNNAGGTALTITRTSLATAPNSSGQVLRVSYNPGSNGTSPSFGGFFFATLTAANKVFVTRFVANIPIGRQVDFHSNGFGSNNNSYWLTNNVGTGKWEEYVFVVMCGNTGTFSSTNFFAISGGSNVGFTWDIASATVFDVTNKRDLVSSNFESYQSSNALTFNYLATNLNGNNPVPIYAFDVTSGAETRSIKAGIGYERHLTNGRGTLHIYNRSSDDITNITGLRSSAGDIKVSIDNAGNVGVGITIPNSKLHVFNSAGSSTIAANAIAVFEQSSNAGIQVCVPDANEAGLFFSRSGAAYYSAITRSGTDLLLKNNSATAVTINSNGNVGVGITDPTAKLDVIGSATSGYSLLLRSGDIYNGTDSVQIAFGYANTTNYRHSIRTRHWPGVPVSGVVGNNIDFYVWKRGTDAAADLGSQFVMTMQGDGNVGIGTTNPSARLDVRPTTATAYQGTVPYQTTTAAILSPVMAAASVDTYTSILQLVSVREALVAGRYAHGYLGFSTVDNSNINGILDAGRISIKNDDGIGSLSPTSMGFWTNTGGSASNPATERVRIASDGNVGIGTISPGAKLDVNGSTRLGGIIYNESVQTDDFNYFNLQPYIESETLSSILTFGGAAPTFVTLTNTAAPFSKVLSVSAYGEAYLGDYIPVQAGETIYGEIWTFRATGAAGTAGTFYCGVMRYDKDKKMIDSNQGLNTAPSGYFIASNQTIPLNSTWTKYSGTLVLPTSHPSYATSDGGPVRYIRPYIIYNYTAGTILTYIGGWKIRKVQLTRDSGPVAINGSVAIGSNSVNYGRLQISATTTSPSLSATNPTDPSLIISNSDVAYGTMFATYGDGKGALQQRRTDAATYYDFSLQPHGGNVGIATLSPANKLAVLGSVSIGSGYNTAAPANGLIVEGSVGIGVSTLNAGAKLHVVGNADIGDSAADTGIIVRHGAGSAQYGRIRFYSASTNIHTIHSFPTAWNSGTFLNASAGAINLQGTNGVTFGSWNSIDVAFAQGGNNYFKGNVGIGITIPSATLHLNSTTSGATLLRADGTNGTLFSVIDDLSDSLMSVNNSAGLPVLEVFADDRVVAGQYGANDFVLVNNKLGLGTNSPAYKLDVRGSTANARVGIMEFGTWPLDTTYIYLQNNTLSLISQNYGFLQGPTGETFVNAASGQTLHFRTGNTQRWAITSDSTFYTGTGFDASNYLILQNNTNEYGRVGLFINAKTFSAANTPSTNDGWGIDPRSGIRFRGWLVGDSNYDTKFVIQHLLANATNAAGDLGIFAKGFSTTIPAFVLTGGGSVGISTTTPAALLQVGTGTPTGTAGGIQFGSDTGARIYRTNSSTIQVSNNLTVGGTITGALTGNVTGNVSGTAGGETFATVTGRGASTSTQIGVGTSSSGSMYTGIKSGAGYSDAVSGATFKSITDHPTGGSFAFAAYYNGAPGTGTNSFYVGADGSGYFRSTLTTSVIKADAGANYPHSFTNTDAGNTHWVNRSDRLLTSNGTGWQTDGRDPIMALVTSGNTNNVNIANSIGLALHNESQTNNTFSPAITFSNRSNSGSYNTTYAAIIGRKTGQGPDSNWSAGELHFYTMPVGAYVNNIPSLIINSAGNVGVGITAPTAKLNVLSTSSLSSVLKTEGVNGTLFEVTDDLSNSLMSVNTIGGLPVFEVFANNSIIAGQYGQNDFVISGNKVGIGTASPLTKLHIYENVSRVTYIAQNSLHTARFEAFGTATAIDTTASNGIFFRINSSSIVKFAADGNVGIGTVTPANKLHVLTTGGVVNAPNVVATFQANTNTTIIAGGGTAIKFVGVSSGGNLQDYDQCMISSLGYADNNRHGMQFWVKPNASTALTAALTINADSSVVANSSVTATSFSGPLTGSVTGTATNATQLGGVAASSYVRNDVDGTDSTALFRLKTVTKSLTVTAAWTDTGISGGSDLESGAYILTLNVDNYAAPASGGQYNETYTGIMYWYAGATNSADYDEIPLHKSGHAPNGRYINLRTLRGVSGVLKLQITCNLATGGASNYIFKFRRMI